MNHITRVFLNTDMRNQHDGLAVIAKNADVDLSTLSAGEHVVFVNSRRDRVKLFSFNGVLSYLKSSVGPVDLNLIEQVPLAFEGSGVNWAKAAKLALLKKLKKEKE